MADKEESAETVAVTALAWIAGNEEMMTRFLALTGIEAKQIRTAATEPGFLAGVLDFLLAHEPSLMAFCNETETDPETVQQARLALASPDEDAWLST